MSRNFNPNCVCPVASRSIPSKKSDNDYFIFVLICVGMFYFYYYFMLPPKTTNTQTTFIKRVTYEEISLIRERLRILEDEVNQLKNKIDETEFEEINKDELQEDDDELNESQEDELQVD